MQGFLKLIEDQFRYGGQKYAHSDTKESTDCLFDDFGKNWLFGTLAKYCKRYSNLARERDLLKISCYCFIIWLKRGFHIKNSGTIKPVNTTVETKSKYFKKFKNRVKKFIDEDFMPTGGKDELGIIYTGLKLLGVIPFDEITEDEVFVIFANSYYLWKRDIKEKGKDCDCWNETKG